MATYADLLEAIKRVQASSGDVNAWMKGLSPEDLLVVNTPASVIAPERIDAVLTTIRRQHPDLFTPQSAVPVPPPTSPPPTTTPTPDRQEGAAADAIRDAEVGLAHQNSATAQVDLQVVTAILNAHATNAEGRATLDALKNTIEAAVTTRTDLDTPGGARAFQRFLVDKLRQIRGVVETASLDATSKASLAAALASLYSASRNAETEPSERGPEAPSSEGNESAPPAPESDLADMVDVGSDPLLDELLNGDPGPLPVEAPAPAPAAPAQMPMLPAMPTFPGAGGGGVPSPVMTGGLPGVPLPQGSTAGYLSDPLLGPEDLPPDTPDSTLDDPGDGAAEADKSDDADAPTDATRPPPSGSTTIRLPSGDTVTAPNPQIAAAIRAAASGTALVDAFRQQGITIPPPGTAVAHPVDVARLIPGDIGMFTDRQAVAIGNSKALMNGQIQPISSVSGPSFLGWEHPPKPGAPTSPSKTEMPTPTRPAVTAGLSR